MQINASKQIISTNEKLLKSFNELIAAEKALEVAENKRKRNLAEQKRTEALIKALEGVSIDKKKCACKKHAEVLKVQGGIKKPKTGIAQRPNPTTTSGRRVAKQCNLVRQAAAKLRREQMLNELNKIKL
jgi:F420-0:gamma-glutamyl ligase